MASSGGSFSRDLERRARIRRHGDDPAAADRAALRRPLRARSAGHAHGSAAALELRHREIVLEPAAYRRGFRDLVAHGAARRRGTGYGAAREDTVAADRL